MLRVKNDGQNMSNVMFMVARFQQLKRHFKPYSSPETKVRARREKKPMIGCSPSRSILRPAHWLYAILKRTYSSQSIRISQDKLTHRLHLISRAIYTFPLCPDYYQGLMQVLQIVLSLPLWQVACPTRSEFRKILPSCCGSTNL